MYLKIIDPEHSNVNYGNIGSASRCANYLTNENHFPEEEYSFFNNHGEFTKSEVLDAIDNNVKGLKSADDYHLKIENGEKVSLREYEKFTSIMVSPSADEIELFRSNPEMEKEYISQVMDKYGGNFNFKKRTGDIISFDKDNLVWFAIRHDERVFKSEDSEVKEGLFKEGDIKPGENMHWHIIVSNRDKDQRYTMNPIRCKLQTFNRNEFYYKGVRDFSKMYDNPESLKLFLDKINYGLFSRFDDDLKEEMTRDYFEGINNTYAKSQNDIIDIELIERLNGFSNKKINSLFSGLQTLSKFQKNSFNIKSANNYIESYLLGLNFGGKVQYYKNWEHRETAFNSVIHYIKDKYNIKGEVDCTYKDDQRYDIFQALINLKKDLDKGKAITDLTQYLDNESKKLMNDSFLLISSNDASELKINDLKDSVRSFSENYNEFYSAAIDTGKVLKLVEEYTEVDKAKVEQLSEDQKESYVTINQKIHKASRLMMSDVYNGFIPENPTEKLLDYTVGLSKYGKSDFQNLEVNEKIEKLKELTRYINKDYDQNLDENIVIELYKNEAIGDEVHTALVCYKNSIDNDGKFTLNEKHNFEFIEELKKEQSATERLVFISENIKDYHDKDFEEYYSSIKELAQKHDNPSLVKDYLKSIDFKDYGLLSDTVRERIVEDLVNSINQGREEPIDYNKIKELCKEYEISDKSLFAVIKSYPEEYLKEDKLINSLMQFSPRGKEKLYMQGDETVLESLTTYINKEYYKADALDVDTIKQMLKNKPQEDVFQAILNLKTKLDSGEFVHDPMEFIQNESKDLIRHELLYTSKQTWDTMNIDAKKEMIDDFIDSYNEFYGKNISKEKIHFVIENLHGGEDKYDEFIGVLKNLHKNKRFWEDGFEDNLIDNYAGLGLFSYEKFQGLSEENKREFIKNYVELLNKFYLPKEKQLDVDGVLELFDNKEKFGDKVFKGLSKFKFLLNNGYDDFKDSLKEVERLCNNVIKQTLAEGIIQGALGSMRRLKSLQLDDRNTFNQAFKLFRDKKKNKQKRKY